MISRLFVALFVFVSSSVGFTAPEKVCKCRSSKSGAYLEMMTTYDDGRMTVSSLESFTMNGPKNAALCQEELKKRPECGAPVAAKAVTPVVAKGVKITAKQMKNTYYQVGLLPNDQLLSINKVPTNNLKDLNVIDETEEKGGRVDLQVQRGHSTVDLWFEFPKPPKASE
jgi:PDZ domain